MQPLSWFQCWETMQPKRLKQDSSHSDSSSFKLDSYLLGGWTNPFEKYARQIGIMSPRIGVKTRKYLKTTPGYSYWVLPAKQHWKTSQWKSWRSTTWMSFIYVYRKPDFLATPQHSYRISLISWLWANQPHQHTVQGGELWDTLGGIAWLAIIINLNRNINQTESSMTSMWRNL